MSIEEIKKQKVVNYKEIRKILTGEEESLFECGYIGFHPNISDHIVDEVLDLTEILDPFILKYYKEIQGNYHYNSQSLCYFLSSLFCLANSSWKLIQGEFDFIDQERKYYHSWIQKEGITYDPVLKTVTSQGMYKQFFIAKYHYNQEQVKELFQRTGMFTYYEEDLNRGVISPFAKMWYYDTPQAKMSAEKALNQLNSYLKEKQYTLK